MREQAVAEAQPLPLVIDENSRLTSQSNLALDDDLPFFGLDAILFQNFRRALLGFKYAADDSLLSAMPNHIGGCFVAQQERKRVDQNGLASAGLAGKQVQARGELHRQAVYYGIILDA